MSLVSRFIDSVSQSCAADTRASRWKNAVAFLESMKVAMETSTPALNATRISTSVKPRPPSGAAFGARPRRGLGSPPS